MNQRKAYKVVRNQSGKLLSAIPSKYEIAYTTESLNEPKIKNSYLFVFNSIDRAKSFIEREKNTALARGKNTALELWEVEIYDYRELKFSYLTLWELEQLWIYYGEPICSDYTIPAPQGTLGCKSLKMIRKIQ